ncbi:transposase is4 [Holotrichia oblita]|uniref:Transposase is4 n=1 Tax=Holotrichia oblita TaxID=644536 RepID=A0ACB9SN74_HOLOL|nr:transposase is4 [Holotrichia oblita]
MWWEVNTESCNTSVLNAMRRNTFEKIKRYIHCRDNTHLPDNDKFARVRPYFQKLNEKCRQYGYYPEQISIDESMIPYFCKHGVKQFLKGKPIRYGYKMWCMCEPSGYLLQFEPYQGKTYTKSDLGVGGSVVMNLVNMLPANTPFKIYGDRFFFSLKLVAALTERGIGYTGTIKSNRIEKCPIISEKDMKKKERGYYDYCTDTNNNCTVTNWNDNRIVLLVSSCDSTFPVRPTNRWVSKEKKKLPVSQMLYYNIINLWEVLIEWTKI